MSIKFCEADFCKNKKECVIMKEAELIWTTWQSIDGKPIK